MTEPVWADLTTYPTILRFVLQIQFAEEDEERAHNDREWEREQAALQ
jgi:hypothetical protein